MNKPITPGHITRWLLLLQEFDITIIVKQGKYNMVENFLSRLNINDEYTPVKDIFPDEHIFSVSTHTPWYADVAKYLPTGEVPHHFPYKE